MRVLVAEPKTRTRRIRFPAPEGCTDLTALDEAPLRQPRVDMGEHRLRGLAVDVGEYPLRQFPMEMPCKSKSHRPAKSHLRWIQYLFVLVGLMGAGVYGWLYAEARVYQAYESWRLNQIQQGLCQTQLGPASDGSAEGCPSAATVPPRPERGPDHPSSASGATRIGDGLARGGNRILYQLEMPLRDIYPPIWLRIQLWENETLTELRTERDRLTLGSRLHWSLSWMGTTDQRLVDTGHWTLHGLLTGRGWQWVDQQQQPALLI